jgi:hypothetical protein
VPQACRWLGLVNRRLHFGHTQAVTANHHSVFSRIELK